MDPKSRPFWTDCDQELEHWSPWKNTLMSRGKCAAFAASLHSLAHEGDMATQTCPIYHIGRELGRRQRQKGFKLVTKFTLDLGNHGSFDEYLKQGCRRARPRNKRRARANILRDMQSFARSLTRFTLSVTVGDGSSTVATYREMFQSLTVASSLTFLDLTVKYTLQEWGYAGDQLRVFDNMLGTLRKYPWPQLKCLLLWGEMSVRTILTLIGINAASLRSLELWHMSMLPHDVPWNWERLFRAVAPSLQLDTACVSGLHGWRTIRRI
jgi:hypothetical protein